MKITTLLVPALLFIYSQPLQAQCTVSITNIDHGSCEDSDIELIASSNGSNSTYEWTGPNGFTCTNQYAMVYWAQPAASGYYKVIVTEAGGCTATDSIVIIKHPSPIVYTGGDAGGCLGTTTYIYAMDFGGNFGPYTYQWDNGQTTETLAITHGGGSYPAPACLVTNAFGCAAYNNTTFMIYTTPTPSNPVIEPLGATTFCNGLSVDLVSDYNQDYAYTWSRNDELIETATTNQLNTKLRGNYTLAVTNLMGCSALSNTLHVKVNPLPTAEIITSGSTNLCDNPSLLLTASAGQGYTYEWKKYTNFITGANLSSYSVGKAGIYRVKVSNEFGCSRLSKPVTVTNDCRLEMEEELNTQAAISVYPNPSNSNFNLLIGTADEESKVMIADMTGHVVEEATISKNEKQIQFGQKLPAGVYMVEVVRAGNRKTERVIKTN